ncbi:MAG: ABC transporter ATP-binding protein [Candidatus Altiarchaeota archaeon]|nr:ABC transporter ATP-binding protein [Candidatus Altiarchaeota archaeon]
MKPIIEFKGVSYRHPDARENALYRMNSSIPEGSFVLVQGPSGSGKTTFLKCINGLIPHYGGGVYGGNVTVNGRDTLKSNVEDISSDVGTVFQDPENQIVCTGVESEIAFGLENMRLSQKEIEERIKWIANELSISNLLGRKTSMLSAGEKQKIVTAAVIAMKPKILLLDEPCSQLDQESVRRLNELLLKLNKKDRTTIVLVEHNYKMPENAGMAINMGGAPAQNAKIPPKNRAGKTGRAVVRISNLSYSISGKKILDGINLSVHEGEHISITGPNGSGKTTLLKHLNGLLKPGAGDVTVYGMNTRETDVERLAATVGLLSQNPDDCLFCESVEGELSFTLANLGKKGGIDGTLRDFSLSEYKGRYPRDLSGGERQRVALASIMVASPKIIALDEPTRGIDPESRSRLLTVLDRLKQQGSTIIIATHDADLAERADRTIRLSEGRIAGQEKHGGRSNA